MGRWSEGGAAMSTAIDDVPNPGSDQARQLGCVCAVLDNSYGRYPDMGYNDDGSANWSIRMDCPIHARQT